MSERKYAPPDQVPVTERKQMPARDKKALPWLLAGAVLCCVAMTLVDGVLRPAYWLKSLIKLALFLGVPFALARGFGLRFGELFRFKRRDVLTALALGAALYALILGGYFVVRRWFDFSGIADSLSQNAGVTRENFLFVSLYISFINSLLEEFFFRGFVFSNLKTLTNRGFAHGFSALAFSAYHVAMMAGWFSPALFALVLAGLAAGGVIFNLLNEKNGSICTSWLVHMFANFAINTIGFLLL